MRWWWLVIPAFVLVGINSFAPIFYIVYLSFTSYHMTGGTPKFIGLENYYKLVQDPDVWMGTLRGLGFSIMCTAIELLIGLCLALALKEYKGKIGTIITTITVLPLFVPPVTVGTLFYSLAKAIFSPIPYILGNLGIRYQFGTNPYHTIITIVYMDVWHWTSLVAIILLAALSGIPSEYYEAARIDRASRWTIFRRIVIPHIRFPMVVAALIRFIDTFKIYDEIWVLTGWLPITKFLSILTVRTAIGEANMGYGSAIGLSFLYIVIIFTALFMLITSIDERRKISK
jgi:glycerol transport system permease protein